MSWRDDLQPASWRGVGFAVMACTVKAGRNLAPHAYPYREDTVIWIEDLGLAPRRFQFVGYLCGDDVAAQQDDMLDAVETAGVGEMVHPQLGSVFGKVVEFTAATRAEKGGMIEVVFDFIEQASDAAPSPELAADTQSDVRAAAGEAGAASVGDFDSAVLDATPADQAVSVVQPDGSVRQYGPAFSPDATQPMLNSQILNATPMNESVTITGADGSVTTFGPAFTTGTAIDPNSDILNATPDSRSLTVAEPNGGITTYGPVIVSPSTAASEAPPQRIAAQLPGVTQTIQGFSQSALRLVGDASALARVGSLLLAPPGRSLGRYADPLPAAQAGLQTVRQGLQRVQAVRGAVIRIAGDAVALVRRS